MAKNFRINVSLNDSQYKVVEWMAKRDGITVREELSTIFWLELWNEYELYKDEANGAED